MSGRLNLYHPSRGYWEVEFPHPDYLLSVAPEGTVEVPQKPASNYDWNPVTSNWEEVPVTVPTPGPEDINRERERPNMNNVATVAITQVQAGNGSSTITWRDNADVPHVLTYEQVIEMHILSVAHTQSVYDASWVLKETLPANYTADEHWP